MHALLSTLKRTLMHFSRNSQAPRSFSAFTKTLVTQETGLAVGNYKVSKAAAKQGSPMSE